jgi:serine/threonine protein kinase/tetratricopeptide (TPR) repeat protein
MSESPDPDVIGDHELPADALDAGLAVAFGRAPVDRIVTQTDRHSPDQLLEKSRLGDFRILGEIGRGGMGVVYKAEQITLNRQVALKVLPFASGVDARRLQRFKNEAQAAALLHHQNIVPVYAVGCERGMHYYAMQFIDGQTLADLVGDLRRQSGLDHVEEQPSCAPESNAAKQAAENHHRTTVDAVTANVTARSAFLDPRSATFFRVVAQLGVQAAEALEHAHQLGVVHRDIKPANLLVDMRCHLWVTDFGLARLQDHAALTLSGDLMGTLRYMSPEQAEARPVLVDHRTDLYSLGASLYELLTLEPVCPGRERPKLLRQITLEEALPPRQINPAIPRELETIVLKALAKSPVERYPTAQELADDLRRFLEDKPIRAKPPTPSQRLRRWTRRHRAAVVSAAVSVGVLLLGALVALAVSNVYIARERDRKDEALREKDQALAQARASAAAAEEQRRLAEANLQLARKAVDDMYAHFGGKLANMPHMQPLQRDLLLQALNFYQEFAKRNSADPGLRQGVALASLRVGSIDHQLGQPQQAAAALEQAIALYETLVAEDPAEPRYRYWLAVGHYVRSLLLADNGQGQEAEPGSRRAIALLAALAAEFPESRDYRLSQGAAYSSLGLALLNRPQEAEAAFRAAIGLCGNIADDFPDAPLPRDEMVRGYYGLGLAQAARGRHREAERSYREALARSQRGDGSLTYFRFLLPKIYLELAHALRATGRDLEAETGYRQALALAEKQVADFPALAHYWQTLEASYRGLGDLLDQTGRPDEAAHVYLRALDFHRGHAAERSDEAAATQAMKRAVALAKKATDQTPQAGSVWNTLGLGYYRAGDWKAAIAALEKSMELYADKGEDAWRESFNTLVLAMAHWHLGNKTEARAWYDRAVRWQERYQLRDEELLRLRAEAAALLKP